MTVKIIDPSLLIEPETQGAKRRRDRTPPTYTHQDQLNQPIEPGSIVAFAYAYSNHLKLGTVIRNTRQRVRIAYKHRYTDRSGQEHVYEWNYLAQPGRILVITDTIQQEILLAKLKGLIP
jgi:hypothetical protein